MTFLRLEVEPLGDNRVKTFFTYEGTYWEIDHTFRPHRAWWVVMHDGWVVAEMAYREFMDGPEIRWVGRVREPIPAEVSSHLPQVT